MNETEKWLMRRVAKAEDPAFVALRDMIVTQVLTPRVGRPSWSLQGFGMLRTYLSPQLRLHVWDPAFRVPNVTEIHDHPWDFTSVVLAGRIRNVRYRDDRDALDTLDRPTHVCSRIMCGPQPTEPDAKIGVARLVVASEDVHVAGESYAQKAAELHASYADPGTVTLCRRSPVEGRSPDHALVYWPLGGERVSAEPRPATDDEIDAIVGAALEKMIGTRFPVGSRVKVTTADHPWGLRGVSGTVRRVGGPTGSVHHVTIDDEHGNEIARELFGGEELASAVGTDPSRRLG